MNIQTPLNHTIPLTLGLGLAFCSPSHAALIGAGAGTMGPSADTPTGGRTNIDQSFTSLAPGIYDVSDFNYWGVNTNGTVTPFLSTQTAGAPSQQYTPIWVGGASTPVVGTNTVTYTPGSQQIIVPNAINVYSGFSMTNNAVGYNSGGLTDHNGTALSPTVGTQLPSFSNNNLPRTYSSGITVTSSLLTSAAVGPGSGITDATNQDTPGQNRLNVDRQFLTLPAGIYSVSDWNMNVFDNAQPGAITPMLLTGVPGSYTSLWLGSAFNPTANGIQSVSETGSFTLGATTNIYAGFFSTGNGSGIIALDQDNSGSGNSVTDHDSSFTPPTGTQQTVAGFSNPGLGRTYAFGINITQVPEPSSLGLLAVAGLALFVRRR